MDLVRITDLSRQLDVSSRSLRYYEQVGLLSSVRPAGEKYRYYEPESIERLRQILVLRKMQIPIKDILRIYESHDMRVVVEAFVERINVIEAEVTALSEMKRIIQDFLQIMQQNGITKISALPLLYEEMDRQLSLADPPPPGAEVSWAALSERLAQPLEVRIVELQPMRMLTSLRSQTRIPDAEGFWAWLSQRGIDPGLPGQHTLFECQGEASQPIWMQKAEGADEEDSPFATLCFAGGRFAVCGAYADDNLGEQYRRLIHFFDDHAYYEVDYRHDGKLRQEPLIETVLSPDDQREKVDLFLPVKKRVPDASLYAPISRAEHLSVRDIERANPVLWERDLPMDRLIPILDPYYHVNEAGEAEFISFIDKRMLSTGVEVRIPFRVDIECKVDGPSRAYAHGSDEGSIRLYHGRALLGMNMENNSEEGLSKEALCFRQPVFGDEECHPGLGRLSLDVYHHLAWIVGERYFAVFLDGQVRYCGTGFPYMTLDPRLLPAHPVVVGSNGKGLKYIRSLRVAQLRSAPKTLLQGGALRTVARQSNNILPVIHPIVTLHYGENYWFCGCAKYAMELLGEPDFDYWLFSGLTGDNLAQVYSYGAFRGDGATDYRLSEGDTGFIGDIFRACGYASTFAAVDGLCRNRDFYLRTLLTAIDRGVPVIFNLWKKQESKEYGFGWGLYVGYEDYGNTLLFLYGDQAEPARIPLEDALPEASDQEAFEGTGWIFIGEKKRQVDLGELYRDIVLGMPALLETRTGAYCFGAEAFRAWASNIEDGRFEGMQASAFDDWAMHKVYVCNMATNGSCRTFLERALALHPEMDFLREIIREYKQLAGLWNGSDGMKPYPGDNLESLGGGFNATLDALQDPGRRGAIAAKLRECAACYDRIVACLRAADI